MSEFHPVWWTFCFYFLDLYKCIHLKYIELHFFCKIHPCNLSSYKINLKVKFQCCCKNCNVNMFVMWSIKKWIWVICLLQIQIDLSFIVSAISSSKYNYLETFYKLSTNIYLLLCSTSDFLNYWSSFWFGTSLACF